MSDPFSGVPAEARPGLDEVLARALFIERTRLGDADSAEAVTWTLFQHLLQCEEARPVWRLFTDEEFSWPAALVWGGEALGEQAEYVREQLLARPGPPWAPDVALEFWPAGLAFVTTRYLKPNLASPDGDRWARATAGSDAFSDPSSARASGRLELAQAWRVGCDLAGRRRFTLVNLLLLPERVEQRVATDLFRASLAETNERQFKQLTWRGLMSALPQPWPDWLLKYAAARRLL